MEETFLTLNGVLEKFEEPDFEEEAEPGGGPVGDAGVLDIVYEGLEAVLGAPHRVFILWIVTLSVLRTTLSLKIRCTISYIRLYG